MDASARAAAEQWLQQTGFIATVETAVNQACLKLPADPAGFVVRQQRCLVSLSPCLPVSPV